MKLNPGDIILNGKYRVERLLGLWDSSILRGTRRRKPSGGQRAILEAGGKANLVAQMEKMWYNSFAQ